MQRAAALSALVCLLVVTAAAPASPGGGGRGHADRARSTLLDSVPRKGVLRVCTTGDYRPFTHREAGGGHRGIDVDMARDLAKSLDAEPRFVPTTWKEIVDDVADRRCDIAVGGISVTLPRARTVYFSEPTREDGKAPIARCADKDAYRTLQRIDRPGTRVVVNPGGTNEQFARAHIKRATITVHPDNTTIFREIAEGRADVMITDASETRYQAGLHPELCAIRPDEPFTFAEKAYALPRGDEPFKEYVDQFVHLATHDGTYAAYEARWMRSR
ncbi:transporter substrate-binding domain-containing protein [Streptomyces sp. CC224B]|uniref:transporter substrate-binding domain-containing protein n=1 Tax=Streptomyces sp. CC224B TaxID=3044571 RepID=UPI0024A8BA7F|nr:transporter substrate-binding domain-containing protein [Streptomyces sp. CC224B]